MSENNFSNLIETIGFNQYPDYCTNYKEMPLDQEFVVPTYYTPKHSSFLKQNYNFKTKTGEEYSLNRNHLESKYNIFIKDENGFVKSTEGVKSMWNRFDIQISEQIEKKLLVFPIEKNYWMDEDDVESIEVGDIVLANSFWWKIHEKFSYFYEKIPNQIMPHFICGEVIKKSEQSWGSTSFKIQTSKTDNIEPFELNISVIDVLNFGSPSSSSIYKLNKIARKGEIRIDTFPFSDYDVNLIKSFGKNFYDVTKIKA